jgi:hypothetical protein
VLLLFFIFINSFFKPVVTHTRKPIAYPRNGSNHVGPCLRAPSRRPWNSGASGPASVVQNENQLSAGSGFASATGRRPLGQEARFHFRALTRPLRKGRSSSGASHC